MLPAAITSSLLVSLAATSPARADVDAPQRVPRMIIGVNPLSAAFARRFGADLVYFPNLDPSFAVLASAHVLYSRRNHEFHFDHQPSADTLHRGFGGELGARFFRWNPERSAAAFVGPSIVAGTYFYEQNRYCPSPLDTGKPCETSYASVGVSVDAGVTFVSSKTISVTGGVGLQYIKHTQAADLNMAHGDGIQLSDEELFNGDGFRPRLLVTVGGAF